MNENAKPSSPTPAAINTVPLRTPLIPALLRRRLHRRDFRILGVGLGLDPIERGERRDEHSDKTQTGDFSHPT